jgi:predicted amidophosphoribosyltransferase
MICPSCQTDNKDKTNLCKKCGANLTPPAAWRPTWQWHAKALASIYLILIVLYFAISAILSRVPEPYRMRSIPKDITPWLK